MAVYRGVLLYFVLLGATAIKCNPITIVAAEAEKPKVEDYRLNSNILPENYALELTLNDNFFTEKNFKGSVKITFTVKAKLETEIILNAEGMTLDKTLVPSLKKQGVENDELLGLCEFNAILQRLTCKLKKALEITDKYEMKIVYTGTLFEDMYGFYLSSYVEDEQKEWIATTQFQPTYARRAFPSFDEPNFKATFDIKIIHPAEYRALSNAGIKTTDLDATKKIKTTTFKQTPKMSTYLVAFVVSKFASMNIDVDNLSNAVWSQQALIDTAQYGLGIAPKILQAMEEFTGVAYSVSTLSKLDQIAIPDFSAGAMENWGLVTYRESALLWDKAESTAQSKQRVATIVAHELAHMWFGNLITTDWWSSTWLNEGFARYFQYYAADKVEKDWQLKYQFVLEQQQSIFNSDALHTVEPLTSNAVDVLTRDQISNKFDSITYNKGASVIHMLEHIMGEEKFLQGIQKYTEEPSKNQFKNVVPKDLWDAMSLPKDVSLPEGVTMEQVMETWTAEPGFPVVFVNVTEDKFVLTAERFFFKHPENTLKDSVWYIPISYTTSKEKNFDDTKPKQWIKLNEPLELTLTLEDDITWLIVNLQSSAYIRVNYTETLWKTIEEALKDKHEDIHILNRAQIVDDSLNLARADMITYNTAFDVVQYLEKETEYYPWYSAFNAFAYLKRRINNDDPLGDYLNKHISNLMQELYNNVSFVDKSEQQVDIYKKVLALSWACELGFEECVEDANDLFQMLSISNTPVRPDLRGVVYCTAIRNSEDREYWDFLWERFTKSNMATEATTIISALGCSKDTEILEEYLEKSITENSGIRKQDAQSVFQSVIAGNHEGVQVGLDFLENNYQEMETFYGGMNALTGVITSLADRLTTKAQVEQFTRFVTDAELGSAQASADSALERCEENMQWVEYFHDDLLEYLKAQVDGRTTTTTQKPGGGGAGSIAISSAALIVSILALFNR